VYQPDWRDIIVGCPATQAQECIVQEGLCVEYFEHLPQTHFLARFFH
jgi:hypothetical protein